MASSPFGKSKSRAPLLRRPSFSLLDRLYEPSVEPAKDRERRLLKKKTTTSKRAPVLVDEAGGRPSSSATEQDLDLTDPSVTRPAGLRRGRPSSIFGSLKSFRTGDDDTPPATATSSKAPSVAWKDLGGPVDLFTDISKNKNVLHHGEVYTHSGLFWKKKEYLVLTESHLVRFKSQSKAAETFHSVLQPYGRAPNLRHASSPSCGSNDNTSVHSESSGEKVAGIPLDQIVAVHKPDEPKHAFSVDISYLDVEIAQGATINLQFSDSDELDLWIRAVRTSADRARLADLDPIPPLLSEWAARAVERERDYDLTRYRIYKVVKKAPGKSSSSSADDLGKLGANVCFLVIGVHKIHLVALPKNLSRVSTTSLTELNHGGSFGILALNAVILSPTDDSFTLGFRTPFQKPRVLHLASLASSEIALRIRHAEHWLRPGWTQRPYIFQVPEALENRYFDDEDPPRDDFQLFDACLTAYAAAYGFDPSIIRYTVNLSVEDAPRFELLESIHGPARPYSVLELLATLRALRYNTSFASISFAGTNLNSLNGTVDALGTEHVCTHTARGNPIKWSLKEQSNASLLVQEVRAIAVSSSRLRRLDFSHCITKHAPGGPDAAERKLEMTGCGVVEALFPLCKQQATNVDWICLNGIELQEVDLDYLVGIAAEKGSHFRAIEASGCGLTDRGMALLFDVFRAHGNTLEALDISNNPLRLVPNVLSRQLQPFGYIRRLDLSSLAIATGTEPLLPVDTLVSWRLEDFRLRGLSLNHATVDALCGYLGHAQSEVLREFHLVHCALTGEDVAALMKAMTTEPKRSRLLHLDVSENNLQKKHRALVEAIKEGLCPSHFSMRSTEYDVEESYEELLLALAVNTTTRYLDISKTSLPCEASEDTIAALYRLFAENDTLEDVDISGEDSRLETSKIGSGINQALRGLKQNKTLQVLRIQYQKLGLQGASTIAEIIKGNDTLRHVHCENNAITLTGFTDIINALARNTSLTFLPALDESREAAVRDTEAQIKSARAKVDGWHGGTGISKMSSMKRTFAPFAKETGRATPPRLTAVPQWTEQDVQAAIRLVREGWESQAIRLRHYLDRNWRIFQGEPLEKEQHDSLDLDEVQRPGTAGSIGKVLERVAAESTPTFEKQTQLGDVLVAHRPKSISTHAALEHDEAAETSPTSPPPSLLDDAHTAFTFTARAHEEHHASPHSSSDDLMMMMMKSPRGLGREKENREPRSGGVLEGQPMHT